MALTPAAAAAQGGEDRRRRALRIEVRRRYAWEKRQRRDKYGNGDRLKACLRLCELERLFQWRWGYTLPADDAGRDDLIIAAHHIAHLGGDVRRHIVAWAEVWAPWLPKAAAEALAAEVMKRPLKWRAGTLGWRLRLTAAERHALAITTIRAFDMGETEQAEQRKAMQAASSRKRRARMAEAAGRVPGKSGRPRKNPSTAVIDSIGVDGFSARARNPHRGASTLPQAGEDGATVPGALEAPPADLTEPGNEMAHDASIDSADAIGVLRRWWPRDLEGRVKVIRLYERGHRGDGDLRRVGWRNDSRHHLNTRADLSPKKEALGLSIGTAQGAAMRR